MVFYDPLTQLPNRQMLMDRLERALAQSDDPAHSEPASINGALMFIDQNSFKVLNDTLARLGGDEFVVMLESLPEKVGAATEYRRTVGRRIFLALSEPYGLAGYRYDSICSNWRHAV